MYNAKNVVVMLLVVFRHSNKVIRSFTESVKILKCVSLLRHVSVTLACRVTMLTRS
jgi:hypothetical protein